MVNSHCIPTSLTSVIKSKSYTWVFAQASIQTDGISTLASDMEPATNQTSKNLK